MYLIDTHAHIDMLSNPEQGILEAREAGVKEIIIPSGFNCFYDRFFNDKF